MRLHVASSGGFAGLRLQGEVRTADLPPQLAERAERLLSAEHLAEARSEANPNLADGYVYELLVWPDDRGEDPESYLLSEADTSPEVMQTLHDLIGEITRRNRDA